MNTRAVGPVTPPPGSAAPAPTRVIRLESGVDWQEGTEETEDVDVALRRLDWQDSRAFSQQAAPPPQAPPTQQTPPSQEVRRVLDGLPTAVAAQVGVTLTLAAPVTRTDGRVSGASMRNLSQPFAVFRVPRTATCAARQR